MKSKLHTASVSEPGLHVKLTKTIVNGSKSIGSGNHQDKKKTIVLGSKNRGTSKLDGTTK